jgi:hypothetical protein
MKRCARASEGVLVMGHIRGEGRSQGTSFPGGLDDLISADSGWRVIDAFVAELGMAELGFVLAGPVRRHGLQPETQDQCPWQMSPCSKTATRLDRSSWAA